MGVKLVRDDDPAPPSPRLNDIPNMLRKIADEIDAGTFMRPNTLLWVAYDPDGEVRLGCLGDNPNKCEIVGMLTLAQRWFDHGICEHERGRFK